MYSEHDSLDDTAGSFEDGPYDSSLASSASSSSTSVFSETLSQSSDNTSISCISDASQLRDSYCHPKRSGLNRSEPAGGYLRISRSEQVEVAQALRQNPRRTGCSAVSRNGPPTLARQGDRKVNFVDNLVDSSTQIVEAIWPLASVFHRQELGHKAVLPLRTFIQETLRRSRTSYSTLQVALYYLILIKPHVPCHDFTMEQPDDLHSIRALQCGRRMFLAALILASKYLQDRNYSARAWSKISGLATQEINQNEIAFLSAVNWKLHITDAVFKRWTEIILKHTPSQPPSSGSACVKISEQQCLDWQNLILQLEPDLGNIESLLPLGSSRRVSTTSLAASSNPSPQPSRAGSAHFTDASDVTPTPQNISTPTVMEPLPATVYTPGRFAPALGLLPTPRLTPQSAGLYTPAVTAVTSLLGGKCSMSFAMAQAASVSASQNLDKWPGAINTSPQSQMLTRRPSLANSVSTASSPESMISDSSRTSRSSSISSASSLASAPSVKLDVQARCRNAMLYGERYSMKPGIASVPEDYEEGCLTSSPESYTGTDSKDLYRMTLNTPLTRQDRDMNDAADAARALQELHNYNRTQVGSTTRSGLKRSRRVSTDECLQENVRGMLSEQYDSRHVNEWHDGMVDGRSAAELDTRQTSLRTSHNGCRKRLCYSAEGTIRSYVIPAIHPAVGGPGGPGMWEGILN